MLSEQLYIGTIPVDVLSFQEALDAVARLVNRREGGFIFTPNVDHVVLAEDQEELRRAYASPTACPSSGPATCSGGRSRRRSPDRT